MRPKRWPMFSNCPTKELPKDFLQITGNCEKRCKDCGVCMDIAKDVLIRHALVKVKK